MHKQRISILAAMAVGVISLFLPWGTMEDAEWGEIAGQVTNFFPQFGYLAPAFVVSSLLVLMGSRNESTEGNNKWIISGLCGTSFVWTLSAAIRAQQIWGDDDVSMSLGIGVWLAVLATAAGTALPHILKD